MTSLYQIANDFRQNLDLLFDENGEALPEFEEHRALIGNKINMVAAYILNTESDATQAKAAIERIKAIQTAYYVSEGYVPELLGSDTRTVATLEDSRQVPMEVKSILPYLALREDIVKVFMESQYKNVMELLREYITVS